VWEVLQRLDLIEFYEAIVVVEGESGTPA